ncbi:YbaB/EbfC family nucleoid-associated protein [Micromonospora sp. BRA006-A]|nr:YbaB/EbfC family nucleoid-associated protein [Micromonospora sp. BRA006-A]
MTAASGKGRVREQPVGFRCRRREGLLRQAQEQQRRLAEVQRQRAELRVTGESPDGLVRVTVDGDMKVGDVELNARAMRLDSFPWPRRCRRRSTRPTPPSRSGSGSCWARCSATRDGPPGAGRHAYPGGLVPLPGVHLSDPTRNLRR